MPGFIGATELLMLALVALLVFGPKRLPEMGRSLGHGLREFKDSVTGENKEAADNVGGKPSTLVAGESVSGVDEPLAAEQTRNGSVAS